MEEVWSISFEVEGRSFEAVAMRRPFREGFEVHVHVDGEVLTFAEFGFGDSALIEKARAMVGQHLKE
ncbi:MAG: hypothetical protein RIS36_107 [Pseudomonadota bacterium]|jgi:hypothetical protein